MDSYVVAMPAFKNSFDCLNSQIVNAITVNLHFKKTLVIYPYIHYHKCRSSCSAMNPAIISCTRISLYEVVDFTDTSLLSKQNT